MACNMMQLDIVQSDVHNVMALKTFVQETATGILNLFSGCGPSAAFLLHRLQGAHPAIKPVSYERGQITAIAV